MLRCRAVQAKLTAYIHGELPLKARRRVAAHLEHCPRCQSAYQRQRELVHELERELPRMGQGHKTELARVWSKVQSEIYAPETPRPTLQYRASYGVAVLMMLLAMVVPYALSRGADAALPSRTLPARIVAFATDVPDDRVIHRVPENALSRTAPAVVRVRFNDYMTPQAALTPAPRP